MNCCEKTISVFNGGSPFETMEIVWLFPNVSKNLTVTDNVGTVAAFHLRYAGFSPPRGVVTTSKRLHGRTAQPFCLRKYAIFPKVNIDHVLRVDYNKADKLRKYAKFPSEVWI